MNTDISNPECVALAWFTSHPAATTSDAIKFGINLAVESKDKEITRLLESKKAFRDSIAEIELSDRAREKSKDRRIAELTEENAVLRSQVENADINLEQVRMAQKSMWRTKLESAERRISELEEGISRNLPILEDGVKFIEELRRQLQSKDREIERLKEYNEILSKASRDRFDEWHEIKQNDLAVKSQLSSAQAEIEKLKGAMKQIWDETDPYADGAPDSGAMPLLANQISGIARQFVKHP